jgi:hypothetical protein
MTQDPLHRLIRHLNEEEHQGVLRFLRRRGGNKHAPALYKAMRKEQYWEKEQNLAYANTLGWSTRHLAVEKKNLYARLLKYLRRRGDTEYAIQGIYESLHHFYLLRDRGLSTLALKSLHKARDLAHRSDHLELLAFILYQECLMLRQSEALDAHALETAAAEYATVTQALAINFDLLRGFNRYFSDANKNNPDPKDPGLLAMIDRYSESIALSPRLEYDRLVFFYRLWTRYRNLVPFDILSTDAFYTNNEMNFPEFRYLKFIEYIGFVERYVMLNQRNRGFELLKILEQQNREKQFPPIIYLPFFNARFFYFLNSKSKEQIAGLITGWVGELLAQVNEIEKVIICYQNFATYYLLCHEWTRALRWVDDVFFLLPSGNFHSIKFVLKNYFYKFLLLFELNEKIKLKRYSRQVEKEVLALCCNEAPEILKLYRLICKLEIGSNTKNIQICSEIVDLYRYNNNLNTTFIKLAEIYIWASAKVHCRDTYEEYYRLRDEPD